MRTSAEPAAVARLADLRAELRSAHAWARAHDRALAEQLSRALHLFATAALDEEVLGWGAQLGAGSEADAVPTADVTLAARLVLAGDLEAARARAARALDHAEDHETRLAALEVLTDSALYARTARRNR